MVKGKLYYDTTKFPVKKDEKILTVSLFRIFIVLLQLYMQLFQLCIING